MSRYKVRISHHFEKDIKKINEFLLLKELSQNSIKRVLEKIYHDLMVLSVTPKIGIRLDSKISIRNEYRYLISDKYIIFYKIFEIEKVVRIYHIYHCKENYLVKLKL